MRLGKLLFLRQQFFVFRGFDLEQPQPLFQRLQFDLIAGFLHFTQGLQFLDAIDIAQLLTES